MGTTRMHDSPRHGVVDRNCRVHELSNLWVAGSSVFPTCGANYPTITLVALALRLSDRLAAEAREPDAEVPVETAVA
jgi:choline dehydrogenase-like flavoprotein